MKIKISDLDKLVTEVLRTEYTKQQTDLIKEVVLFGELSGRPSHGILRLIKGNYGVFVDGTRGDPEYIHKTKISTLIDSKRNPGMLIGPLAMLEAIKLAKKHDIGIVGTKGSYNSIGSLTYYCEKIARQNLIVIMFAQSMPQTAPFTIKKALFGSNPIAFGVPSDPNPLIFDMSTSSITFGTILKYKADGKRLPPNVAIDKEGHMTTDPQEAIDGATYTFDTSYKGSGLAMMVELLASLWPGGSYEGLHYDTNGWGNLFLVLSPELLSDTKTLQQKTKEFIETLRNSPTRDDKPVRIPGEHTRHVRNENIQKGEIEISDVTFRKIQEQLKKT